MIVVFTTEKYFNVEKFRVQKNSRMTPKFLKLNCEKVELADSRKLIPKGQNFQIFLWSFFAKSNIKTGFLAYSISVFVWKSNFAKINSPEINQCC